MCMAGILNGVAPEICAEEPRDACSHSCGHALNFEANGTEKKNKTRFSRCSRHCIRDHEIAEILIKT